MVNVKPSRFGSLRALMDGYDYLAERGIGAYGGGQFELGPGRGQIQYLASLFHPDTPNDVAPGGYNVPDPPVGPARQPASTGAERDGLPLGGIGRDRRGALKTGQVRELARNAADHAFRFRHDIRAQTGTGKDSPPGPLPRITTMAGHSKWAQIKRKKGAADARRGQLFTKLARAITVAARDGGGDPDGNAALANAIEKAKALRMPKENIERAIARGSGAGGDAAAIETVTYEGYGPGGVAILIECLTDNRNRTAADIRHIFTRADASLGEPGSVSWMFDKRGVLLVDAGRWSEDDLMPAIDAGAEDMVEEGDSIRITCEPAQLRAVSEALEQAGVEVQSTEQTMVPRTVVELGPHDARKLLKLLDALDEQDDVDQVHANFDINAEVLEEATAA